MLVMEILDKGGVEMLVHVQCGGLVRMSTCGHGVCVGCGKKVNVRLSNK